MKLAPKPERDQETLRAIEAFWALHGYAPSIRDIADELGMSATGVYARLRDLREAGRVDYVDRQPRTLKVVPKARRQRLRVQDGS